MRPRELAELILLAAIWGASFLFLRIGAAAFGAAPLAAARAIGAALCLLPLLAMRASFGELRKHWRAIAVVGLTNTALPFVCYSFAALWISAGLAAIFNATTPLWGALIAWIWLGERPQGSKALGLAIGFAGVVGLAWTQAGLKSGADGLRAGLAVAACLFATLNYGWSGHFAKRRLAGIPPLALAAGSQLSASCFLLLPALASLPARSPGALEWSAAAALAVVCTGLAYILYFRLIANAGAANAMSVTFLIPAFAMVWGALVLGERPDAGMLAGAAVILVGTALAVGLVPRPRASRSTGPAAALADE